MASVIGFFKRINAAFINPPAPSGALGDSAPLKFGILGAARIAPPALITPAKSHAEVEIYAVAARDIDKAEKFARKYDIKKWYGGQNGYQDLLDDPEINVIYNPLPNGLHYEWTMKALANGKHVLVEKPSSDTAEETRRMFEFANQKGLVLLEAFHYRFHPAIQRVKEIIDSGELESVTEIHAALCLPKGFVGDDDIRMDYDIGGGAMMDCGCYPLSCVRYLAKSDPTAVVSATATKFHKDARIDTATSAALLFPPSSPGGEPVKSTIRCDFSSPGLLGFIPRWPDISVRVLCEQGSVELFNFPQPVLYHTIKVIPTGRKARTEKAYRFSQISGLKGEEWWSTYRYQLEAFVDQVKGRAPNSWMTSEDSVANMEWIEKIYEAGRSLGCRKSMLVWHCEYFVVLFLLYPMGPPGAFWCGALLEGAESRRLLVRTLFECASIPRHVYLGYFMRANYCSKLDVTCMLAARKLGFQRHYDLSKYTMTTGDAASNRQPEIEEPSEGSRRPVYKTETTGNYWQDVWIAFKVRVLS
ncbi:hypothetical protein J3R82DRAFT_9699 [Butyriboletus roseoflavus]|nr:hypothetical protein J3R82DRAFT_9699 [Butyriboletus roseoflavus]